jgi:hypothetical protein
MGFGGFDDNWFGYRNLDDCFSAPQCDSKELTGFYEWNPLENVHFNHS